MQILHITLTLNLRSFLLFLSYFEFGFFSLSDKK